MCTPISRKVRRRSTSTSASSAAGGPSDLVRSTAASRAMGWSSAVDAGLGVDRVGVSDGRASTGGRVREVGLDRLVVIVEQRRRDQHVGGREVAGDRNVPQRRQAKERLDVGVVRLRLERIPEEDEQIDRALGDPGSDLLVAAERSAHQPGDLEPQLVLQQGPGRPGGNQVVLRQRGAVELRPAQQLDLLVVVSDECDYPPRLRGCHGSPKAGGNTYGAWSRWLRGCVTMSAGRECPPDGVSSLTPAPRTAAVRA